MICRGWKSLPAFLLLAFAGVARALAAEDSEAIDYNRQIRTILSDKCFRCHGPDEGARESALRLDLRDSALKPAASGGRAIVPGQPAKSRIVERIFSTDPIEIMPPPEINKKLSEAEKQLLKRWIAQGAPYQQHWSFVTPVRPGVPQVHNARWARNDIDRFILARLEAEGLKPALEADRATLIRRVTLDLTGLPPTPAEVDAFLADTSPRAYEKVVDRLLSNAHYGERMAVDWLDASRYADTHGYHIDSGRDMTRWREWVIDSFNRNKPFDAFTIEQVAGDLLPEATVEQQIASGFHRNHMINFEGGAIPEEYQAAYVIDRVSTTGTVWLGLTVGCAQCHDHKYDPISQREFYQLYAFFHNVPEKGLDGITGNATPLLKLPTPEQRSEVQRLQAEIAPREHDLRQPLAEVDRAQELWERAFGSSEGAGWVSVTGKPESGPDPVTAASGATLAYLDDKSVLLSGTNPLTDTYTITFEVDQPVLTGLRLEVLSDESLPGRGPGRSDNGNFVLTDVRVAIQPVRNGEVAADVTPVKIGAASADFSQSDFQVAHAIDADPRSGWGVYPEAGKSHAAVFEFDQAIQVDEPCARITVTLDFQSNWPRHQAGRFRLSFTRSEQMHPLDGVPRHVRKILAAARAERSEKDAEELRKFYRSQVSPVTRGAAQELKRLQDELNSLEKAVPTTMVMQEMDTPRDTFILMRGEYDKKGDKVTAGIPAALPPLPQGAPFNRLGLAQWLVSPSQPLTARVTVNRYWQMFFGTGLVKTTEDFGSQGEQPSHPELLDWLAVEFMGNFGLRIADCEFESDQSATEDSKSEIGATPPALPSQRGGGIGAWDVKALVRLMVTSAAYRQSSAAPGDLYAKDPENRLLGRGPRFRLQAEFIRDQALAVSGLLNTRIGGHSVSPYQPAGLWEELMSREDGKRFTAQTYEQSHGEDLYRRTMYTFWKRSCPPPTLATFDAPDRETCTVRRARTNTPLQALVLLNDPTYIEASRKLAERLLTEGGAAVEAKLILAFRLATAREPSKRELEILKPMLEGQLAEYRQDRAAAEKLLAVGESPRNMDLDVSELAAWTTIASAILNLDETVTRG